MRNTLILLAILTAACGDRPAEPPMQSASRPTPQPTQADNRPVILCFGNSLTAGFGVDPAFSYPSLLQQMLDAEGKKYRVVNAGISGDTTSGGVSRMAQALSLKPAIVLLELGANDGLRGLPIEVTRANLEEMINGFQKAGAKVFLAGMTLPRNYGPEYIAQFEALYKDLAKRYNLTLIPFLLEPMVAKPGLMQQDGLHPTAEGYRLVVPKFLDYLRPALQSP